jgi:hypothetical protein
MLYELMGITAEDELLVNNRYKPEIIEYIKYRNSGITPLDKTVTVKLG